MFRPRDGGSRIARIRNGSALPDRGSDVAPTLARKLAQFAP
jgi:hypothetical protein